MKPKSFYSIFSITSLLLLSICACNSPNEKQKENKPLNVIYIMADDHAYQAVSAYGSQVSKLAPTPNIDRIANEGARMDAVYCTNSICGPSRASILTGKFSHVNGFYKNVDGGDFNGCLLYTSPSPRDNKASRMPSSA